MAIQYIGLKASTQILIGPSRDGIQSTCRTYKSGAHHSELDAALAHRSPIQRCDADVILITSDLPLRIRYFRDTNFGSSTLVST